MTAVDYDRIRLSACFGKSLRLASRLKDEFFPLKIRVSVVRFRDWPPEFEPQPLLVGVFYCLCQQAKMSRLSHYLFRDEARLVEGFSKSVAMAESIFR